MENEKRKAGRPFVPEDQKCKFRKTLKGYKQDMELLRKLLDKARKINKGFNSDTEVVVYTMDQFWRKRI